MKDHALPNEPKYGIRTFDSGEGTLRPRLVNMQTGRVIPEDEPVFVFRAKDCHAVSVLRYYLSLLHPRGPHYDAVSSRRLEFENFRAMNPDKMQEPTTLASPLLDKESEDDDEAWVEDLNQSETADEGLTEVEPPAVTFPEMLNTHRSLWHIWNQLGTTISSLTGEPWSEHYAQPVLPDTLTMHSELSAQIGTLVKSILSFEDLLKWLRTTKVDAPFDEEVQGIFTRNGALAVPRPTSGAPETRVYKITALDSNHNPI